MDFKVGDVVRLKSGGPLMTVRDIKGDGPAFKCIWFDDQKVLRDDVFYESELELGDARGGRGMVDAHRAL